MGRLRTVTKSNEPGFISFQLEEELPSRINDTRSPQVESQASNITLTTLKGTQITLGKDVSLKNVARLVHMLECRRPYGVG